jgi:hypothetical protein
VGVAGTPSGEFALACCAVDETTAAPLLTAAAFVLLKWLDESSLSAAEADKLTTMVKAMLPNRVARLECLMRVDSFNFYFKVMSG